MKDGGEVLEVMRTMWAAMTGGDDVMALWSVNEEQLDISRK
jgi:hypothetical protein